MSEVIQASSNHKLPIPSHDWHSLFHTVSTLSLSTDRSPKISYCRDYLPVNQHTTHYNYTRETETITTLQGPPCICNTGFPGLSYNTSGFEPHITKFTVDPPISYRTWTAGCVLIGGYESRETAGSLWLVVSGVLFWWIFITYGGAGVPSSGMNIQNKSPASTCNFTGGFVVSIAAVIHTPLRHFTQF